MGDFGKGRVKLRKNMRSIEKYGLPLAAFIKPRLREFENYGFVELTLRLKNECNSSETVLKS
ncbi:MAG: hypothetical protein DID89_2727548539 [Candidatus Nitrotoga sp. CP45]|nr:MAG: hypothetical protein DID89_2727548539 [Candidatus Nitrotoga sp. CP45]